MDINQGIVCQLTGTKATFTETCQDFIRDTSVAERQPDDTIQMTKKDLVGKLSYEELEKLKVDQNLPAGVVAGVAGGLIMAATWAIISVGINYQIGYMAIGVGAGVGFCVRYFGKGIDQIFGFWGAGVSLFSCILGNIFSIIAIIGSMNNMSFFEVLPLIDYSQLPSIMVETFSPIDIIFYGLAVSFGYKLSFRNMTEKNLKEIRIKSTQS